MNEQDNDSGSNNKFTVEDKTTDDSVILAACSEDRLAKYDKSAGSLVGHCTYAPTENQHCHSCNTVGSLTDQWHLVNNFSRVYDPTVEVADRGPNRQASGTQIKIPSGLETLEGQKKNPRIRLCGDCYSFLMNVIDSELE